MAGRLATKRDDLRRALGAFDEDLDLLEAVVHVMAERRRAAKPGLEGVSLS